MIDNKTECVGPFEVVYSIHYDEPRDPVQEYGEDGAYGPTDSPAHLAWKRDEWTWCYLLVRVMLDNYELALASLGGLEYGSFPMRDGTIVECDPLGDDPGFTEMRANLRAEAIEEARRELHRLAASIESAIAEDGQVTA